MGISIMRYPLFLRDLVMNFGKEQTAAITHIDGPMMVIAGPGSGKTTVITHRTKYLIEEAGINPTDILVITFTKAAAGEMESRFKYLTNNCNYNVRFGTFHSIFFWIIKTAYGFNNSVVISENEKRELLADIIKNMNIDIEKYGNREDVLSNIVSQISILKSDMINIDDYYSTEFPEDMFREVYKRLDKEMIRRKKIDFDDMMVMCYQLLVDRPDILKSCQKLFKYIMVDEFQDSCRLQYEILKLLGGYADNVFIVGDDDQSVYSFRGARPEIMQSFKKDYPDTKIVKLEVNYRCDKNITDAAAEVIKSNSKRFEKNLSAKSTEAGVVEIFYHKNEKEEFENIIHQIRAYYAMGIPYEKQAVLYRTNSQPRRLAYRLEKLNIPFTLSDSLPNIFEHFVIKTILEYIRFAMGDIRREVFLRIMNKPTRYISRNMLIEDYIDFDLLLERAGSKDYLVDNIYGFKKDMELLKKMRPTAAVNFICKGIGYEEYLKKHCEDNNLDFEEMSDLIDEFADMVKDCNNYIEMFDFIKQYSDSLDRNKERTERKGVKLMTMHSAKGLEFDVVYVMNVVEGVVPYKKAKASWEIEEERRMFYVAMTRARHYLYIYAPKELSGKKRSVSRFINKQSYAK